jgi:transcriptional regulator with XRE-family HTH domain
VPEQLIEQKSSRQHGKTWHDRGPTWRHARRLYLKYPLLPAADLARMLGVSRQTISEYVEELKEEREKRREEALLDLKRKEGL